MKQASASIPVAFLQELRGEAYGSDRAAKELQFEGIIAKRKGSCYVPGRRTSAWVKYKLNQCQEFVIGGYTGVLSTLS